MDRRKKEEGRKQWEEEGNKSNTIAHGAIEKRSAFRA